MAEIKPLNPWTWQDALGFSQAVEVRGGERVLYCAGQTSVDANGAPLHAGDMEKQIGQAFDNLETVLAHAEMTLASVVRLNYYTTDVQAFFAAGHVRIARLRAAGISPSGTLLEVAGLFHPDILIEIEATAVAP
jgi:enamine deaminase RidA (YjgF/YER057c/UK114 family)